MGAREGMEATGFRSLVAVAMLSHVEGCSLFPSLNSKKPNIYHFQDNDYATNSTESSTQSRDHLDDCFRFFYLAGAGQIVVAVC